jgi:tail tape measure protein|nr:MAG TPA: tail tape measure protein [Caudoviricetes sp.]
MGTNFDVTAILKANVSDFARGMKEAQMAFQSMKNQTGSSLDKISNSLSTVGTASMKLGAGMSATLTAPVVAGVTGIVKSFADLEQSLGGVETLFKDNGTSAIGLAKKYNITAKEAQEMYDTMEAKGASVLSNANNAFKTAGVSANQYMQQVTSFSATLLQGLGGDTEKAAQYADKALVQMADNANKMGTNMSDIQNAYQGFAKDNYTMLDNLKLGYGGTAGEMARLVNESGVLNGAFEATAENVKDIPFHTLIEAIGITQDRLGITGTTAKEASETVSGSFQAMKASFENLVAGLGHGEADIYGLFENLKETVLTFKDNVVRVLLTIWDNLPLEPWQKWLGLIAVSAGPALIAIGGVVTVIGKLVGTISFIAGAVSKVSAWFTLLNSGGSALSVTFAKIVGVVSSLGAPFLVVIAVIASLIAILVGVYNTSEEFRNKVNSAFEAVRSTVTSAIQEVVSFVMEIFGTLISWWNENHALFEQTATTVWNTIKTVVETVTNFLAPFIEATWNNIVSVVSVAWDILKVVIETALNVILGIIKAVMQIINGDWAGAWETIQQVLVTCWEGMKALLQIAFEGFLTIIQTALTGIKSVWDNSWNAISNFLSTIWEAIKTAISSAWEAIKSTISTALETTKSIIQNIWNSIVSFLTGILEKIKSGITNSWENIKSAISNAIENIKNVVLNGWNNVVSTVTNAGTRIVEAVKTGFRNAVAGARDFISNAYNVGRNLIMGFVNGVRNAAGALIDAVGGAVKGAINWAKGLLGIHSPSRVFRQFGEYTDEGFIIGVNNQAGAVMKSVGNMAQGAIDAFTGKDLAGTLQGELNAVDGQLGRLTGYDTSVDFNGGTITVGQQSADIVLKMGNTTYRAFTEDITSAQEMELTLATNY